MQIITLERLDCGLSVQMGQRIVNVHIRIHFVFALFSFVKNTSIDFHGLKANDPCGDVYSASY